jgi:hypothetical protein
VMAIILSSSDSAPFSSVMICWNTASTTMNMSFRDELFALGVWTDWLGTYWLCLKGGGVLISPTAAGQACATGGGWGYCCSVLLRIAAAKDSPGVLRLEENTLPVVVLDALCDLFFRVSSLTWLQRR